MNIEVPDNLTTSCEANAEIMLQAFETGQLFLNNLNKYFDIFLEPLPNAVNSFLSAEQLNPLASNEDFADLADLVQWNMTIAEKNFRSGIEEFGKYSSARLQSWTQAWIDYVEGNPEKLKEYYISEASNMKHLATSIDKAVSEVEGFFGFKLSDANHYKKIAETDRFKMYQVMPNTPGVSVRDDGKPVLLVPPYVLGHNILAFLPNEGRSYAHSFANKGIPTYIRVIKNINEHQAVQQMTGENDVLDTKYFCECLVNKHGKQVSLNGYCQGGFMAMTGILTGRLDEVVDTLITCVAPLDGTKSPGLTSFINSLPSRYRNLEYATKTLENGNRVIDGKLMGWVFKLKNMERESPFSIMMSDMKMIENRTSDSQPVPRIAAAINRWICGDRTDLPLEISKMSYASYTIPIDADGNLPFELFGQKLNLKHIEEKDINFLICYAEKDDLVEKSAALAPLEHIKADVTAFPKGHGAIATSWSKPDSPYPLDGEFGGSKGPVRYHLEIEEKIVSALNQNAA